MELNCCALNTSATPLFLDHITPLASLLEIPLIVSDENNAELTGKYYPEVFVKYLPDLEFRLNELTSFDALIECNFWPNHLKDLFLRHYKKEMRLIFCPHGQSDKGYGAPTLTPYAWQESVLIYGELLKEMLLDLNLWPTTQSHAKVGNFRYLYYQKHRERLLAWVRETIFSKLNSANKTALYAPTWNDADDAGTCSEWAEKLLRQRPDGWNVILKLHPLLVDRNPALYYRALSWEEKFQHCAVVGELPFVYPLLELIDVYLGDYSSIGYDALTLHKPMCFLAKPPIPTPRLHSCGTLFDGSFQSIEQCLINAHQYHDAQKTLYEKAFAAVPNLKGAIRSLL
jgi:hypothetical protein